MGGTQPLSQHIKNTMNEQTGWPSQVGQEASCLPVLCRALSAQSDP